MVAMFSGTGLGLFATSWSQFGGLGGRSGIGQGRDNHLVNVQTGNLVLTGQDEILASRNFTNAFIRYYNSRGTTAQAGNDGWLTGYEKTLRLVGTLNTAGSKVVQEQADGGIVEFAWDGTRYVSTEGAGAHDTIAYDSTNLEWMLTEGSTQTRERYAGASPTLEGALLKIQDLKTGAAYTLTRDGNGRVTRVESIPAGGATTAVIDILLLDYNSDGLLTKLSTTQKTGATGTESAPKVQTVYEYDSAKRLSKVKTDLTPDDGTDTAYFVTTYAYVDATSLQISSVTQGNGTSVDTVVSYTYYADGKVKTVTQGDTNTNDADGIGQTLTYIYGAGTTDVTNSLGDTTTYKYNSLGQLTNVYEAVIPGQATRPVTTYTYDADGNLDFVSRSGDGALEQVVYRYDANGNLILKRDRLGNTVTWTYNTDNQVATETTYKVPDPDGIDVNDTNALGDPSGGNTRYYFYDGNNRLRFTIYQGEVTEYGIVSAGPAYGQVSNIIRYRETYVVSGNPDYLSMVNWASTRGSLGQRTDFVYDARGLLWQKTEYASVDANGVGVLDAYRAVTQYVYDAQGLLLQQIRSRGGVLEGTSFAYDGMGRLQFSTNAAGEVTTWAYDDANRKLIVTQANGLVREELHDAEGNIISITERATGYTSRVSRNYYDSAGHLRASEDAQQGRTYYFYDEAGHLVGTVDSTGTLTEYLYNGLGYKTKEIAYSVRLDTTGWLVGNDVVKSTLAEIRPGWTANFSSTSVPGFNTTSVNSAGPISNVNGELVFQQIAGAGTTPSVFRNFGQQLGANLLYSGEVRTDADQSNTYLLFVLESIGTGAAHRRAGVHFRNGSLYRHEATGTATPESSYIGTLKNSTTYIVQAQTRDGEIEYTVYEKGQSSSTGFTFSVDAQDSDWQGGARLRLYGLASGTVAGNSLCVDNLAESDGVPRVTWNSYDGAGRLIQHTGPTGLVTKYTYDGASRLVETDVGGRVTRNIYNGFGRLRGVIDADGFLTEYEFDPNGNVDKTIRYATVTDPLVRQTGTINDLRPVSHADDQVSRALFNGRNQVIATVDAEGYFVEYSYNENTNVRNARSYKYRVPNLTGAETLADLRAKVPAGYLDKTDYFNALGQLVKTVNQEGTITVYTYDEVGNLVRTEVAQGQPEVREQRYLYDIFGNLIGEISGEHAVDLAGKDTATQKSLIAQYGLTHAYDSVGRRIETTDQLGFKTWYFYDSRGRLTYTVRGVASAGGLKNAEGEVTEMRYNAFGEVVDQIDYTGRIAIGTPYGRAQVQSVIDVLLIDPAQNARTEYSYDKRGLLTKRVGPQGRVDTFSYTSFGELYQERLGVGDTSYRVIEHAYNARGLETTRKEGLVGSVADRTFTYTYDPFGRVATATDGNLNVTTYKYDRLGRQLTQSRVVDGITETVGITYDAFGRTLTQTDAMGRATTYGYNDTTRSVVVTTPEGVAMTTLHNRFGETSSIVTDTGATTTYEYDDNGALIKTTGPDGAVTTQTYGVRGLLTRTTDATGRQVDYVYDAVGRVLQRIEDPGTTGLKLTTRYEFDGRGNQIKVTDASGRVTQMTYDLAGRLLTVAQDPTGFNIRTTYTWDALDHQLTVTQGAGTADAQTIQYEYDRLGRRITQIVAPGALNLTTRYYYDDNDNLIRVADPAAKSTRYFYDAANRLVGVVDALGGVTVNDYDAAGRLVATRRGATAYTAALSDATTLAQFRAGLPAVTANDPIQYQVYDKDGRLRYTVDATGTVTETRYDAEGRVSQVLAYAKDIVVTTALATKLVGGTALDADISSALTTAGATEALARASFTLYDAAGRVRFTVTRATVDGASTAVVSEWRYDLTGRVIATLQHGRTIAYNPAQTTAQVEASLTAAAYQTANHRLTRYAYDGAGRLRFTVEDQGLVTEQVLDAAGRVTETRSYDTAMAVPATLPADPTLTVASVQTAVQSSGMRKVSYTFDLAGRLTKQTDALNQSELFEYDAAGNRTAYTDRAGAKWTYLYDAAGRRTDEISPPVAFNAYTVSGSPATETLTAYNQSLTTRIVYDVLGNVVSRTEAYGLSFARTVTYAYDARGRQITTTFPAAGIYDPTYRTFGSATAPTTNVTYDALDRAVVNQDTLGNYSYKVYDLDGRVKYDVDAEGYLTEYQYSVYGEQTKLIRYADPINLVADSDWTPGQLLSDAELVSRKAAPTGNARTVTTTYDLSGNKQQVLLPSISYTRSDGTQSTYTPTTQFIYNAFGQVTREIQLLEITAGNVAVWASTYHYYDELGREVMTVDPEGYVTTRTYTARGEVASVTEWAKEIDNSALSTTTKPANPTAGDAISGYDRKVSYTYDALGRKTSESVDRQFRTTDGNVGVRNIVTAMEYDNEGRVTAMIVDGQRTTTTYDSLGRVLSVVEPQRDVLLDSWEASLNALGNTLTTAGLYTKAAPRTRLDYDAFGNVVRTTRDSTTTGLDAGTAQVSLSRYDAQGRLVMERDADGNEVYRRYDAADNLSKLIYLHGDGSGQVWSITTVYAYDKVGRQTVVDVLRVKSGTSTVYHDMRQVVRYNAFGEIISKGNNAANDLDAADLAADAALSVPQYEQATYDDAGNLIRSNAGGVVRNFRYNLAGYQVGESHSVYQDATVPSTTVYTVNTVDKLGRVLRTKAPGATAGSSIYVYQAFDRWNNVIEAVDARGNATNYRYNDQNQLITETRATVEVVGANGVSSWQRPEQQWYYDALGRLVGTRDANGNLQAYEYDAVGRRTRDIDALGGNTYHAYDLFGRERAVQNQVGYITFKDYDVLNRVTAQGDYTLNSGASARVRGNRLFFDYDESGNRTKVTRVLTDDGVLTNDETDTYDYDTAGRLLASHSAAGQDLAYTYDAQGNKTRETNERTTQNTQTWTYDYFGRVTAHVDLGGGSYTYEYDAASGQQKKQSKGTSGSRTFEYYLNGLVEKITESGGGLTSVYRFEYDANGNRTVEESTTKDGYGTDVHTITYTQYDALGRIATVVTEDLGKAKRVLDLSYGYDANGNRRHVQAGGGYSVSNATAINRAIQVFDDQLDPQAFKLNTTGEFYLRASDYFLEPDGKKLSLSVRLAGGGALPTWLGYTWDPDTNKLRVYTKTAPTTDGSYNLEIVATDPAGATAITKMTVSAAANTGPVSLGGSSYIDIQAGKDFDLTLLASDFFGDVNVGDRLTLSASGLPAWMQIVPGADPGTVRLTGTAPASGSAAITLTGGDGTASTNRTMTVRAVANPAPVGAAAVNRNYITGMPLVFERDLSQLFTDGDIVSLTASGVPSWMTFQYEPGTGQVRLLSDKSVGTVGAVTTITLTAKDASGGTTTMQVKLTAISAPGNVAPTVNAGSGSGATTATVGQEWTYTLPSFSDNNGDSLSYKVDRLTYAKYRDPEGAYYWLQQGSVDLPSWLKYDPATRQLRGTPTKDTVDGEGPEGNNHMMVLRVTATDSAGATSTTEVWITLTGGVISQPTTTVSDYWFTYDAMNRVSIANGVLDHGVITVDGKEAYALGYDAAGNVVTRTSGTVFQGSDWETQHSVYDLRGQVVATYHDRPANVSDGSTLYWGAGLQEARTYDNQGRLKEVTQYYDVGTIKTKTVGTQDVSGWVESKSQFFYDKDGRLSSQQEFGRRDGWINTGATSTNVESLSTTSMTFDGAGNLSRRVYTHVQWSENDKAGDVPTYFQHTYDYTYEAGEGYLEKVVSGTSSDANFRASSTTSYYDWSGRRTKVEEHTPLPKDMGTIDDTVRFFSYDAQGGILSRRDGKIVNGALDQGTVQAAKNALNQHYTYVNGQLVASYDEGVRRDVLSQLTAFDSSSIGTSTAEVQAGDTLASIAQRVYGNSSLWYVLAEANAVTDDTLAVGTTLRAPQVKTTANDATTYKPYNPADIIGDTTPNMPYIEPPPKQSCNALAIVLIIVVMVVVTVFTAGAAAAGAGATFAEIMAAGATTLSAGFSATAFVAGVAGSAAGQLVGNLTGVQDGFSIKDMLVAGATTWAAAGVGGAIGGASGKAKAFLEANAWARGAIAGTAGAVANYGANRLAGNEVSFSWRNIAASAVSGAISAQIGESVVGNMGLENKFGEQLANGMAGGIVSLHTRRAFGMDDDVNYGLIAADAFANALAASFGERSKLPPAVGPVELQDVERFQPSLEVELADISIEGGEVGPVSVIRQVAPRRSHGTVDSAGYVDQNGVEVDTSSLQLATELTHTGSGETTNTLPAIQVTPDRRASQFAMDQWSWAVKYNRPAPTRGDWNYLSRYNEQQTAQIEAIHQKWWEDEAAFRREVAARLASHEQLAKGHGWGVIRGDIIADSGLNYRDVARDRFGLPLFRRGGDDYNHPAQFGNIWAGENSVAQKLKNTWEWATYERPDAPLRELDAQLAQAAFSNSLPGRLDRMRMSPIGSGASAIAYHLGATQQTQDNLIDTFALLESLAPTSIRGGISPVTAGSRSTRLGFTRTNAADWRDLRDHWDDLGYGEILSSSNRRLISRSRTPIVDDAWVAVFPEDAGLVGERISMHHIGGYPVTVPLSATRHLDAHMPGGFRYNPGGPGSAAPFYLNPPKKPGN